jgi:hypothetical protein
MLRVSFCNQSVPRAELDQRARDARIRLEQIQQQLVSRVAVADSRLRRIVYSLSFGRSDHGSRGSRTGGPLSNRRPSGTAGIPGAWFEPWNPTSHA